MKKVFIIAVGIFICANMIFCSCEDFFGNFLEKPPGVDVTEDTIFSSQKEIETFLFGTYKMGLHSYYPYSDKDGSVNPNPTTFSTAAMCDEAEMSNTFFSTEDWNSAIIRPSMIKAQEDGRFDLRWQTIRRCNILIERMPVAPVTDDIKKQFTGEALFLRALNNFEMLKRYGGMPILRERFDVSDAFDIPRSSLKDYVEFIINDCNAAATNLKGVTYSTIWRGRVTRLAALALKSKVLLFAASPLFNTGQPYISGAHNELVCYGDEQKSRWKDAADAALEVINEAPSFGVSILNNGDPENDYRRVWEEADNSEIILAEKAYYNLGHWEQPWKFIQPKPILSLGWAGLCVTQNFISKYEDMEGNRVDWSTGGDDLAEMYASLDPRFRQSVGYNGSYWNKDVPNVQTYEGGAHAGGCETGAWMHKTIPTTLSQSQRATPNAIVFRLAEAYLNYAEALNEYEDTPSREIYNALQIIRDRVNMPVLPSDLSQTEMRERIKNERAVELAFEDHRLWDIRRWMDAEKDGVMTGDFYGLKIMPGNNGKFSYQRFVFETRSFKKQMYLHPISENEINKGYLIQNPGW